MDFPLPPTGKSGNILSLVFVSGLPVLVCACHYDFLREYCLFSSYILKCSLLIYLHFSLNFMLAFPFALPWINNLEEC